MMEEINNESDPEVDGDCYHLRSKRRRLNSARSQAQDDREGRHGHKEPPRKRKNPLLHMPTEVLQRIFHYISYTDLSTTLRLVNRRFRTIAEDILNRSYKKIEMRLQALSKSTLDSLQSTQDDLEMRCLCKLLNFLDILLFQHSVLMATIWRYVYNGCYRTLRSCMYGGRLIDVHDAFMSKFVHCPHKLYTTALAKDYNVPSEVSSVVELTKSFCLHFEKVSEEPGNETMFHCGCKILDLLNCASFAAKDTLYERHSAGRFHGKYVYQFSNSWFVALRIAGEKVMLWNQSQRLMHMRLRRIVLAHTEMSLHQGHYDRERLLRLDGPVPPKRPGNSVYTGYGDVHDTFFYYGVMNDGAYAQKFHVDDLPEGDEAVDEDDEVFHDAEDPDGDGGGGGGGAADDADQSVAYRIPYLGTRVEVLVKCPLTHAPLDYLHAQELLGAGGALLKACQAPGSSHALARSASGGPGGETTDDSLDWLSDSSGSAPSPARRCRAQTVSLRMRFECYGATYPRLPVHYAYSVKHERHL